MENIKTPIKKIGHLHSCYYNAKRYYDYQYSDEINGIIAKYKEKAKVTEPPDWYVKRAEIYFTYKGEYYVIGPGIIDTTDEIFEVLSNDIINDLFTVGAHHMFYAGMMD